MKKLSLLVYAMILFSCQEKQQEVLDPYLEAELKAINEFYDSQQAISDKKSIEKVLFLILRECSCVEENIDYVSNNISEFKEDVFFVIKNANKDERWLRLKTILEDEGAQYMVDNEGITESYGLVYGGDKYFSVKKGKITSIEAFGHEVFEEFLDE